MDHLHLTHTLADAFNALADEVQLLADRKTVLEHKLRFAHEQSRADRNECQKFQYLADKYVPATPEIAETLAKLQLPPHTSVDQTSPVPLPQRSNPQTQHQIALLIRDGRRTANQLVCMGEHSKTTGSSRESLSRTSRHHTSMSTALEQDFTVEGRKGNLQCPFSKEAAVGDDTSNVPSPGDGPHHPADPICAAMFDETSSHPPRSCAAASKCPIRFMDKHSPEEIARYVETHKHELPRSHEVCLRRYQKNEDQMKKLDSKYGNIVSMIEGLSQIHQSMLPEENADRQSRAPSGGGGPCIARVETWAQAVSEAATSEANREAPADDNDRQGHFDRPLKEVRVGESPSRPWGISVPCYDAFGQANSTPISPPPAPVRMSSPSVGQGTQLPAMTPKKCPFDHARLAAQASSPTQKLQGDPSATATCQRDEPFTATPEAVPQRSAPKSQPTFINADAQADKPGRAPSMVFTGPVFIGYPVEQAIQIMNHYRGDS